MPQVGPENFYGTFQILIVFTVFCFSLFFIVLALYPLEEFFKSADWFLSKVSFCYRKV